MSESVPAVDGVVHLQLDLEGAVLGGTLTVESVVILDLPDPGHPLAATAAGVVVWREQTSYTLEGDGNRLQTQQLSFSEQGLGLPAAAWRLHVEEEAGLDDLAGAQVFLYLNSDHPRLTSLLEGDAPDPLLLSALRLEMERRLVEAALDRFEELETRSTYDEGSFGEALDRALKRNFPGQSPAEIAAQRDRDRGWFEMTLQARTRFLA
ncbi:hypothetical protein [Kytococcus aerolatus]|uniref:hypothetical protein n=1 Tax=Kytococcus aerolatus TaxID=592308 RepID=UPI000B58C08C|nr:hypothetical protein [Kytococcus aerolatus]